MANKNLFNSIQLKKPKKNAFDLSHDVKLSLDMGELVPIMCMEAVPGDKFKIGCRSLIRFAPLVAPVMHRMDVTMHYYFVPNRIVWPGWEKWIVGDPAATAFPVMNIDDTNYSSLLDYMGIPTPPPGTAYPQTVSALPFAAYQKIYNEYYRDQNLIAEINSELVNGDNSTNTELYTLRTRAWEHDYFTASLPFAQKGAPVDIPLGDITLKEDTTNQGIFRNAAIHSISPTGDVSQVDIGGGIPGIQVNATTSVYDPNGTLETQSTTINDLRRAFRLQEWLEKNARAGTRYIENILAHFGVRSSDKRLQRPEYITGVKSPVVISEVLNTTGQVSETGDPLPQGNMAGHGVASVNGNYGSYYCEEHGYIIGIMSIMPKTAYQQGIDKHFTKYDNLYQYYWPTFANLGEQEVLNKEIYAFAPNGSATFGYVPRYAEYKYMPSRVAGDFRNSLDFWHLGRIFDAQPNLNQAFVECVPGKRIFAVEGEEDSIYCQVLNEVLAIRPMPKFGTPSF